MRIDDPIWLARRAVEKDVAVPASSPQEFRDDVARVARNREDGVAPAQIANPNCTVRAADTLAAHGYPSCYR